MDESKYPFEFYYSKHGIEIYTGLRKQLSLSIGFGWDDHYIGFGFGFLCFFFDTNWTWVNQGR